MTNRTKDGVGTRAVTDPAGMEDIAARVRDISEQNDRLFKRLLEGEKRFRRLAKAVWQVQEEERRRLALELHDGIGQTLTALKNHLQQQRARTQDAQFVGAIDEAFELASSALADTRELSRLLRPPVLDDLGLRSALDWLARIQRERAGLVVDIRWQLSVDRLDAEVETLMFRVAQEALTNVVKHAQAKHAQVTVREERSWVRMQIMDDGQGFDVSSIFDASRGEGFGLRGLRDRVELFGGRVEVESSRAGSILAFAVPLANGEIRGERQ